MFPFGSGIVLFCFFFPFCFLLRASERRVLLIVGVCQTFSHLLIFSSSHLFIFTSSHLHICSSSHLLIFTSSHLHIFSSSHLLIFSSSHLLIFTSAHLLIFTSLHSLLPSCSLALLLSPSFLFLSWRRGAVPTRRHETQPFRTKWSSIAKNWGKLRFLGSGRNPFARNEVRSPKAKVELRFLAARRNPFARNEVRSPNTEVKLRFWFALACPNATLSHEMRFDRQKLK